MRHTTVRRTTVSVRQSDIRVYQISRDGLPAQEGIGLPINDAPDFVGVRDTGRDSHLVPISTAESVGVLHLPGDLGLGCFCFGPSSWFCLTCR